MAPITCNTFDPSFLVSIHQLLETFAIFPVQLKVHPKVPSRQTVKPKEAVGIQQG